MNKYFIRSMAVILPLCLLLGMSGIYATWEYASIPADTFQTDLKFNMNSFTYWEGSEILPNEEGESHMQLIDNLLNGTNSEGEPVGLNDPDSPLSQNLENRHGGGFLGIYKYDYYGSMDGTIIDESIDMEGVFNTDTLGLDFIIRQVDDLTCYIFTTSVDLGSSRAPNVAIGEEIYPIYRSVAKRATTGSDYEIQSTEIGHATSMYYEQLSKLFIDRYVPAFDVDTWVSAEASPIGTSTANAIWTFVGDNASAAADDADSTVWFRLDDAGNRTVTSENMYAEITVIDASGQVIAVSQRQTVETQPMVTVSFTLPANSVYYLKFTGSNYIQFAVS